MKKTLIALAVVAVTGTAFAQSTVNLTGRFGAGFMDTNTTSAGGVETSANGFGVTDGNLTFSASEDLGAGLRASASLDVRVRGRDGAANTSVDGRDATVSLSGAFGTVTLGAVEAGNGIMPLAAAGAPVIGQDTELIDVLVVLDRPGDVDMMSYTTPALIPGLTARVMLIDSIGRPGDHGLQAAAGTRDGALVGLSYSAGPLRLAADFTNFGLNTAAVPAGAASNLVLDDTRTRISGSYDLGVVRLGAGFQTKETFAGVDDKQWMLGISAPLGAFTVGATYAQRDNDVDTFDASAFELGVSYAFSARTTLQTAFLSQERDVGPMKADRLRVRVMHTF